MRLTYSLSCREKPGNLEKAVDHHQASQRTEGSRWSILRDTVSTTNIISTRSLIAILPTMTMAQTRILPTLLVAAAATSWMTPAEAYTTSLHQRNLVLPSKQTVLRNHLSHSHRRQSTSQSMSSSLSMHMGHSHSHHHHHNHNHEEQEEDIPVLSPQQKRVKQRRRIGSIVFAAVATFGYKLAQKRPVTKTDILIFGLTTALLTLSDKLRRSVKRTIQKIQSIKNSILRHSTPPKEWLASVLGKNDSANAQADQVTLFGGAVNLVLSVLKLVVGVTCHSAALIADAGHSMSDLFSDVITLWAVQLGRLPPDEDHPYGHGKFEAIGSLFLALTLLGTGLSVGSSSYKKLLEILAMQRLQGLNSLAGSAQIPSRPALLVALLSIVSKEWLYRITKQVGEKLNSQVVIANAWHHRSDAYSSVMALFAIGLAIYFPSLVATDAAAGMLVAGMICMTGTEILGESIKQLTDTTNEYLVDKVRKRAEAYTERSDIDMEIKRVRARQVGSLALVDVDINLPGSLTTAQSDQLSDSLRQQLLDDVKDDVLDVEVRSGSTSQDDRVLALVNHPCDSSKDTTRLSAVDIESNVRCAIDSSQHSSAISKIHSVSVQSNKDDLDADSDVDILISVTNSDIMTVASVNDMANEIRGTIEGVKGVQTANLFLHLNTPITSPKAIH